jgi:hypothetical protein
MYSEKNLFHFHFLHWNIAPRYELDDPGIKSRWGRDVPHLSRPAMGPTQPPIQWVPGVKQPGIGVDHPPASSDSLPFWAFMACSRVKLPFYHHKYYIYWPGIAPAPSEVIVTRHPSPSARTSNRTVIIHARSHVHHFLVVRDLLTRYASAYYITVF